ncbi:MAG: 4-hydroxy-tetrahydrodipicolinate synthase [Gammaproteobacteria bacterium]|jgi:4-hydroxy-tetrahydrodipicolinate synthase|nr:4-hydroxy-tetrahydrodipicolinate synthase [Gammaproteobacteria bacterium]
MRTISGSIVALVTPMRPGVEAETPLDERALARLVEFHIENGTDGIVAVGTTGESATLDEQEHLATIRRVVELVAGRIPVIAGTGANSTFEAIRLTRHAKSAGVDACLLVTPYYNKPTQEGLYLHHKAVAEAVDIPQILYNVPSRTACDMQPETVARLAKLANIVGIKEATGDLTRLAAIRERCGQDFLLLSGDDATACDFILQGGHGVISVTANVAPKLMHEMCVLAQGGDAQAAHALDAKLQPLHRDLFVEANPIPVKWAVERMGLCDAGIRLPLTWLSAGRQAVVREALTHAGIACRA